MTKLVSLTDRELEVLQLFMDGLSSMEAGEVLRLSKRTIDFHAQNAYEKLGACNRIQAINKARKLRLIL